MSQTAMRESLRLKRWAVVGASDDPTRFGWKIFQALRSHGYTVWPVNPRGGTIDQEIVYSSIAELPEVPEVVDMVVNPRTGLRVMEDIARAGIRYVWMQPGTRSDEIRDFAEAHGITLIEDCVLMRLGAD